MRANSQRLRTVILISGPPALSHFQSPQVSWSVGGRGERLRGNGIVTTQILPLTTVLILLLRTANQNKHIFPLPRVSPGDHPLTKKPEDSGNEITTCHEYQI